VSYSQIYVIRNDVFASDPFEAMHTGSIGFKVEPSGLVLRFERLTP
jgi:hypothetical protein